MELAATVDCMEPFVKATYNLEGDGFLALEVYECLSALYISIRSKHNPNVTTVAKKEARGNSAREKQLLDYADICVKTCILTIFKSSLTKSSTSYDGFQICSSFLSLEDQ